MSVNMLWIYNHDVYVHLYILQTIAMYIHSQCLHYKNCIALSAYLCSVFSSPTKPRSGKWTSAVASRLLHPLTITLVFVKSNNTLVWQVRGLRDAIWQRNSSCVTKQQYVDLYESVLLNSLTIFFFLQFSVFIVFSK